MNKISEHKFKSALSIIRKYKEQYLLEKEKEFKETHPEIKFLDVTLDTDIRDCDISIRLLNGLMSMDWPRAKYFKIKNLATMSKSDFLRRRNIGIESIKELEELCFYAGVEMMP